MNRKIAFFIVVTMLCGVFLSGGLLTDMGQDTGISIPNVMDSDNSITDGEQTPSEDVEPEPEYEAEVYDQFELAALTEEKATSGDTPCPQELVELPQSSGRMGSEFWNVDTRAYTNVSTVVEMLEFPSSALYGEDCLVKGRLQEDNNSDGLPEEGEAAIPHSQVHIEWDPNSFFTQEFILFTEAGAPPSMEGQGEFNVTFNNTETDIGIKNLEVRFFGQWTQDGANYFEVNDTGPEGIDTNGSGTPDTYGCNARQKLTTQQYLFDDDGDATDSDGDTYCDGQENRDGTDPGNPGSTPGGAPEPFRHWVDEEFFDWQHATPKPDPWPSWQNPPNPQLLDNDGDNNIDEDVAAFIARFPYNTTLQVALWHKASLSAKLSTAKVIAGEEFTISGDVADASLPKGHPNGKMGFKTLQVRFDGAFAGQPVASYVYDASDPDDLSSQYSFTFQVPKDTPAGIHKVEVLMNPDLSWEDNQYYRPVNITKEIKVIRPAEIVFDDIGPDAWVYHTNLIYINGSIVDKYFYRNQGRKEGLRLNIDGINYAKQYMFLLYWTKGSTYIQRGPYWINNTNGSFSIPIVVPGDQGLGPVNVTMELKCDGTNYISTTNSTEYVTRAHTKLDLWLDQNNNGKKNEANTYITRVEYVDEFGNVHFWNTAHIKGVLKDVELSTTTRSVGVAGQEITLWWGYGESWQKQFSTTTDADGQWSIDVDIEYGHILGPVAVAARFVENPYTCYYDSSSYYDTDGEPFSVVAMTHLTVQNQQVVKGEDILIKGILYDDRNIGVNNRTVNFYWLSEKEKNDYLEDRNNLGTPIGYASSDTVGRFKFTDWEIPRLQPVGPAYVVATFGGSPIFPEGLNGPKYTSSDAYSKSWSNGVLFNVSAHTTIELDKTNSLRMTRFDKFTIKGKVWEAYHGESLKIPVKAVPVEAYIIDSTNTEFFFGRVNTLYDGLETDGSFQLTDTVPREVSVGYATLRVQFNGTSYHLESNNMSFHEIWTETKILVLEKPDDEDNNGRLDIHQEEISYLNPLRFHIKIYEDNTPVDANPIPLEYGQCWLNISAVDIVRYNTTKGVTDENGRHVFNFTKPFRDTQFGKLFLESTEQDVVINITYMGGNFYHTSTKTYDGTIHPPPPPPPVNILDVEVMGLSLMQWLIFLLIILILVAIAVFFTARWLRKRMRIRGMKRIIKRAADQLVAGNEYTAVIFKSYQKLGAHLRKYGYLRRDSETFREFEEAVKQALPIDRISMNEFLALLEEARYSHHKIGEQQRNDAIKNLRNIESSLERIILDESAAMKALEALEEADYTETEILLTDTGPAAGGGGPPTPPAGGAPPGPPGPGA